MRKNIVAMLATVVGCLLAWQGTPHVLNYREVKVGEWWLLWLFSTVALLALGSYTVSSIFHWWSRRRSDIEPPLLVVGGLGGLLLSGAPTMLLSLTIPQIPIWFLPGLLYLLGLRIACQFEYPQTGQHQFIQVARVLLPAILICGLVTVRSASQFPGTIAPAAVRQQWASEEFQGFDDQIVQRIKQCQPIIQHVGPVAWVAPTNGPNYVIADIGSSGHQGELTLEVVGARRTAIANFSFHIDTAVTPGQLIHDGTTTKFMCP